VRFYGKLARVSALCTLAVQAGLCGQNASAQTAMGSIVGTVHDPAGAAVTEVQIAIKNLANNSAQSATSDATGTYQVRNLAAGSYEITASKYGFSNARTRVVLDAHRPAHANLKLKLAAVGEDMPPPVDSAKLDAMLQRIEQLEIELKKSAQAQASSVAAVPHEGSAEHGPLVASLVKDSGALPNMPGLLSRPDDKKLTAANMPMPAAVAIPQDAKPTPTPGPPAVDLQTPFAFADFTWLNGTPRNKDTVVDTPFFTPEVRFDTHYMEDFNQPIDHTIVGSTESFRSGEVQIEQISVGGDFHWQNVRGRILTIFGLFATTTPRNDASPGVGQWDLRDAYRYVSEAYGGYHFNVQHGLNVDAGIFVSYIGLFSYYNFDNWTYQPSYVSSNTPWFFNGVRVQWFPTNKLKIEPWYINGWQSYAKPNGHPGLGGQILYRPHEWLSLVLNQYGFGTDTVGLPKTQRIHTDDSIEVRYYNDPESSGVSKMAFSFTADAGCQYGGGISCTGHGGPKSSFLGWMLYDRTWFKKDRFGLTIGGGQMSNTGRYLTLLPPINGADAFTGTPYFPENPGQAIHQWDSTVTLQYMPKQYITWWAEVGYRHSDVPYFAGRGGVTPPGGNNGAPAAYVCNTGASSGTGSLAAAEAACGGGANSVWFPDLRRSETKFSLGVMVKF
jgi:Putative beta-barrel porin-2, OmpL-like. bbp2/Carboxypeptidase regulatory-like domain